MASCSRLHVSSRELQEPAPKRFLIRMILSIIFVGYFSGAYSAPWPLPTGTSPNHEISPLSGWETYRYENYGLEFQLPEGWQQIESERPDDKFTKTLTFAPKFAEYYTTPYHEYLRIIVRENPDKLPYEKLLGLDDRPDLVEDYYKGEDVTVGGRPAKIIYEQKYQPLVTVQLDTRFIVILSPRQNYEFGRPPIFPTFLSSFKFFDPIRGATNTSKAVKKTPITNLAEWCAKAPFLGRCYYKYAVEKKDCSLVPPNSPASRSQCEESVKR